MLATIFKIGKLIQSAISSTIIITKQFDMLQALDLNKIGTTEATTKAANFAYTSSTLWIILIIDWLLTALILTFPKQKPS